MVKSLLLTALIVPFIPWILSGHSFTYTAENKENQFEILADKIIECESHGDETAVGDGGRAFGVAQFHKPTFDWLCKLSGKDLDYYNANDQRELLIWALENNRGYLWSCFHKVIY